MTLKNHLMYFLQDVLDEFYNQSLKFPREYLKKIAVEKLLQESQRQSWKNSLHSLTNL